MKSIVINKSHNTLKCGICRSNITRNELIYQSKVLYIPVCQNCINRFTKDDVELMLNLFIAYGGYFGQFDSSQFSILNYLKNLKESGLKIQNTEALNISLLYQSILHGISPQEYLEELAEFVI
ncbi:MAG: hypothetical protein GF317_13625 [Candidatus Lokiarchaeota archaeon]|nr:hypothetical protein [Candidatus Lokiarchaeota archaeon]MBD3200680.1 hypothetical protein [Candidatus Lokiarchaeota archaeon]